MLKSKKIKITISLILIVTFLVIGHNTSYKKESGVKQVSAGYLFTLLLKEDNTLCGCGLNAYGQLGIKKNIGELDKGISYTKIMKDVKKFQQGTHIPCLLKMTVPYGVLEVIIVENWEQILMPELTIQTPNL